MNKVEQVRPYSKAQDKGGQISLMFDNIAAAYDRMNAAMTMGLHRAWRDNALRQLDIPAGAAWLDVATGTGDVAFAILRKLRPASVTGIDLSPGMLAIAEKKKQKLPAEEGSKLTFQEADCLSLPFADNSFDAITVAYGVRNFENLEQGYREMHRVLKPGGRLMVIELSRPNNRLIRPFYDLYSRTLIPLVGRMVSGDASAYSYLPQSIAAAPQRDDMTQLMARAGFRNTSWRSLTLGVVCVYEASK